jgi:hypothetical protein
MTERADWTLEEECRKRLAPTKNGGYVCPADPGEAYYHRDRDEVLLAGRKRGSIDDPEGVILAFAAKGLRVLEIGTGLGVSTWALAFTAKEVVTVDIDSWVAEAVAPNLPDNVTFLSNRDDVKGEFGMAFVDGDHSVEDTMEDIRFCMSLVPEGDIYLHDIHHASVALAARKLDIEALRLGTKLGLARLVR